MKITSSVKGMGTKLLVPTVALTAGLASSVALASPAHAAYFPLGNCTASVYYWQGKTATYHHADGNKRYYLIRKSDGSLPNEGNWLDQANWASCHRV